MNGSLVQRDLMIAKLKEKRGILLDLGSGEARRKGFVHMDVRPLDGIDIVHDLEDFPWPIDDEECLTVIGSHIFEHIKPWLTIQFMNEIWRITKYDGQLALSMPYGVGRGYQQDPTHCNPANEATWQYFDPRFELYNIYKPKPWNIEVGYPQFQANGNMEIVMRKLYDNATSES
jgi:hypothetical protein